MIKSFNDETGQTRFAKLTEQQYSEGLIFTAERSMSVEYGERVSTPRFPVANADGFYIAVFPAASASDLAELEAILNG
jgi:hypothetical protein